jgi:hypothetical protein
MLQYRYASGVSIEEILKYYPILKRVHILAAIESASKLVGKTESYIFETAKAAQSQTTAHEVPHQH